MKKIEQYEIQPLLLNILKSFHQYCTKHSITYFMSDGTLLGAVRHQGFIPWDDDIDVSMLADQYDKLLILARENPYLDEEKRYRFLLPAESPNFYPFIKVVDTHTIVYEKNISRKYAIGLWLDIFRLSYCDKDFQQTKKKYHRVRFLRELNKIAICGNFRSKSLYCLWPILALPKVFLKIAGITPTALSNKMIEIEKSMPNSGSRLMDITWADHDKHYFDRSLWTDSTQIDFCGEAFLAPKRYKDVLISQFGNYLELPPEKDRIRHDYEAYYL